MLSTEAVGLTIKIAKGLFKLNDRIDRVLAEKEAGQSPIAISPPVVLLPPPPRVARLALRELLDRSPEEIAEADRDALVAAIEGPDPENILSVFLSRYLPEQALGSTLDLDGEFTRALRAARPDWAADRDLVLSAFFVGSGRDFRDKSYTWRLALTVADVVAEFGGENTALFVRDEKLQGAVGTVLKRLGNADLQETDATGDLMRLALQATVNGVLDAKEHLDGGNVILDGMLTAVADARDALPEEERDEFIVGLLRGDGYPRLVASLLETAAAEIGDEDGGKVELLTSDLLKEVAGIVEAQPNFRGFFQDHWGDLLRGTFGTLERHGPALLEGENPLLATILTGIARDLSKRPDNALLSSDALVGIVDVTVAAVAANPDLVGDTINEEWLATFVSSVASTVAEPGVRKAFSSAGVEALVKDALGTLAKHPELILDQPGLVRDLLGGVLTELSEIETFAADNLASAAIAGALDTLADHPQLAGLPYPLLVASLTKKVGTLVKDRKLSGVQGADLLDVLTKSLAENPQLFLDVSTALSDSVVDVVVEAAGKSEMGLLAGKNLVDLAQQVLSELARSGKHVAENLPAAELKAQLGAVVAAALARVEQELGTLISSVAIPAVVGKLIAAWARGEVDVTNLDSDDFRELFDNVAASAA